MKPQMNLGQMFVSKIADNWSKFKVHMLKNYGENPGTMLVHTGTLGWILSSLAQMGAIVFNDKISPEQKSFLIPQEAADAAINILSFYLVTNSMKSFGAKLVSSGKLRTATIGKFLAKNNLRDQIGKLDFDISKVDNFSEIADNYKGFKNGVDIVTSTIGSIISCNILTPVLRNKYAAMRQKHTIAQMEQSRTMTIKPPKGISIEDYQKLAAMKFSTRNTGLRI